MSLSSLLHHDTVAILVVLDPKIEEVFINNLFNFGKFSLRDFESIFVDIIV